MKRFLRTVWWMIKAALFVAVLTWLYVQSGSFRVVWLGYTVTTRIGVAIIVLLITMLLFAWVFYLWRRLVALPDSFRQQRQMNKLQAGYAAIQKGLLSLHLKDLPGAARQAKQAIHLLPDHALAYYLAAETAKQQNDRVAAENYLQQLQKVPDGDALGLYGLLEMALSQHNKAQALHYARQLHHSMGLTPFVVDTLASLETDHGHLAQAERVLRQALQTKHLHTPENTNRWRNALASVLLRLSDEALQRQDYPAALECAREALKWQPASVDAAQQTALLWQQRTYKRKARKTIAHAYALNPQPALIQVWLQLHGMHNSMDQIEIVERLIRENPDHVVSDLAMADANRRAGLWGVARKHAMRALDKEQSKAVYNELALIEEGDSGDAAKVRHWRDLANTF
jgi:HemY protein